MMENDGNEQTQTIYKRRLTVVGVSAVTRLRMTSMAGRRMCATWTVILFGLSLCLCVPWEMTTTEGERKSEALRDHSSLRTFLPNKVHRTKTPLDNKEVETLRNYCWLDWISRIHRVLSPSSNEPWLYWWSQSLESVVLLVHRADAPQSPWPRFSATTRSAVHSTRQRTYGTHTYALRQARLPQTACISGRTRTPLEQRVSLMQVRGGRAEAVNRMKTSRAGWRQG